MKPWSLAWTLMVSLGGTLVLIAACDDDEGDECPSEGCLTWCQDRGFRNGTCSAGQCECTGSTDGDADTDVDADTDSDADADSDADTSCDDPIDCTGTTICIDGECVPAYGRDYRLTIVSAEGILETNWDGEPWDVGGGLPDPEATISKLDDSWWCTTETIDDTHEPFWNHDCGAVTINALDFWWVEILDIDAIDHDLITGTPEGEEFQVLPSDLREGLLLVECEGITVGVYIDAL